MNTSALVGIGIILLYILCMITLSIYKKKLDIKYRLHLSIVIIIIVLFIFLLQLYITPTESFFFEVSPTRDKCLREQVSRNDYGKDRTCSCCGKGTVGGIPPNYADWLDVDPDTGDRWHRPDNVEYVDTFSNGEEASCRPFTSPSYIKFL